MEKEKQTSPFATLFNFPEPIAKKFSKKAPKFKGVENEDGSRDLEEDGHKDIYDEIQKNEKLVINLKTQVAYDSHGNPTVMDNDHLPPLTYGNVVDHPKNKSEYLAAKKQAEKVIKQAGEKIKEIDTQISLFEQNSRKKENAEKAKTFQAVKNKEKEEK